MVRAAEERRRAGDLAGAATALEDALAVMLRLSLVVPGWLCGRLATVYRSLGRAEDEVRLLERHRDTQIDDENRIRFAGRLTKARTLADQRPRRPSGAHASVTRVLRREPRDQA